MVLGSYKGVKSGAIAFAGGSRVCFVIICVFVFSLAIISVPDGRGKTFIQKMFAG